LTVKRKLSPEARARAAKEAVIKERLKEAASKPNGALFHQKNDDYHVLVLKKGRQVQLYFAEERVDTGDLALTGIMSRIDVYKPLALLGLYTQVMMLSLLWKPAPARIYVAGFGGGRMPLVFHNAFPDAVIDSTEIDPVVIDLAQRFFGIVFDARMRVFQRDAMEFLEQPPEDAPYDIILIDCYTGDAAQPNKLATAEFYDLCKKRLSPDGVLVTNIDLSDKKLDEKMATFAASFPHTRQFRNEIANVLFGSSTELSSEQIASRVAELDPLLSGSLPFRALAAQLQPTPLDAIGARPSTA
jgi:spermidine synthase